MTSFVNPNRNKRLYCLAGLLSGGYVALACWLGYWQLFRHEEYAKLAGRNRLNSWTVPARRGTITDIHGTVLAASAPVKTVCVDPGLAVLPPELDYCRRLTSQVIAAELGISPTKVLSRTKPRWFINAAGSNVLDRFEVLAHNVSLETWNHLHHSLTNLDFGLDEKKLAYTNRLMLRSMRTKMVHTRDSYQRRYPGGRLASHVLGLVRSYETNGPSGTVYAMHGRAGIEQRLDAVLCGTPGWRQGYQTIESRPGLNIKLTLDAGVQSILEEELRAAVREWRAVGGVAVAIRPRTGDILGLASYPDFDPAHPKDPKALQNLAISMPLEPGSTMKTITFATALEDHCFRWDEQIQCGINGRWRRAKGDVIRDFSPHGRLTFLEVLAKSSNIGTAMLAEQRIPRARLVEVCQAFGFGARTGVPLPQESSGTLDRKPTAADHARVAFGHHIDATPLQMAMAYAAIANGGLRMRPRLIDRITDQNGATLRSYPPVVFRRTVSAATCRELTTALQEVVSDHGTARRARLEQYSVAGKTGTAVMYDPEIKGYNRNKDYSSFVGFFPASQPEVCLLVGIIEPRAPGRHGGGAVAAPAWRNMAEQIACYLRIRPDLQPDLDWLPGDVPTGLRPLMPIAAQRPTGAPLRSYW